MKLYNKSGRAFIVAKENVINGGRVQAHDVKSNRVYFDPEAEIEMKDEVGQKMLNDYPKELKRLDNPQASVAKTKRSKKAKKG